VRQENIGAYYVDFVCRAEKLVVEVDGAAHSTPRELAHDESREAWLIKHGFRVLRATNADVFENLDGVCETILSALNATAPAPSPRERGEGWGEGDSEVSLAASARNRPDDQD
jgi:very-short-patch-repair endonuclease